MPGSTPRPFAGGSRLRNRLGPPRVPDGHRRAGSPFPPGGPADPGHVAGGRTRMTMHDEIAAWLRAAAVRVHEEAPPLTALDQAIGDGDHGIHMDRGFKALVARLASR